MGDGKPRRELMYVDDLAHACEFFLKKNTKHSLVNIGSGDERNILEFCKFIANQLNVKLKFEFDKTKPNGTPRKKLDTTLAKSYGWKSKVNLLDGFKKLMKSYLDTI